MRAVQLLLGHPADDAGRMFMTTDGHQIGKGRTHQTTVPNTAPIPAVRAIANAPQNVTRAVARKTLAPPALAPIAPSRARKSKDAADTMGTSKLRGDNSTANKGIAAPAEKVAADVKAA
jgi:hypothetical protein